MKSHELWRWRLWWRRRSARTHDVVRLALVVAIGLAVAANVGRC